VLGKSWAGRSESPAHVLTYTKGALTWDQATGVDANGTACFTLFTSEYDSVKSGNGDKVVAPGTGEQSIVRLKNGVTGSVTYKAVLYRILSDPDMAIHTAVSGDLVNTADYPLPEGVKPEQVLRAVTGTVKGGEFQDFDIDWMWQYDNGPEQDLIDSAVGDRASLGQDTDVNVGLYIVVEDGNSYVSPEPPRTGDDGSLGIYVALMCVSAVMLVLLLLERRRERKCGQ
ncbi:MAG: hypothetical protein ACI3V3_06675, partial [Faecousia sp.]